MSQCPYKSPSLPMRPFGTRCIFVEGHGGEHFYPEDNQDRSDEIRIRILKDRIVALESALSQAQKALEPFALADQNWLNTAIRSGHLKEASITHEAIERLLTGARRDA